MEDISLHGSHKGSQSSSRSEQPVTAPPGNNQLVPIVSTEPSIVSLLDDAAQTMREIEAADPGHVAWLESFAALTTDEKIDALCDKLKLDDQSAQQLKSAYKDVFGWLDPATLSPQEKQAIADLEAAYKDVLNSAAPPDVSKLALAWHALKVGSLASVLGFAMTTLIAKLVTAIVGARGLHMLNIGGPMILLLGEVAGGRLRARGAAYGPADTQAYMAHDRLERQFQANATEAWFVKHRMNIAQTPEEESRWKERLGDLKKSGNELRVQQQRNVVDMLHREFGHELKTKKDGDPADAPSWSTRLFCCSKVEAASDGTVSSDGGELFKIQLPFTKDKAVVAWPDGSTTNLAKERVPKQYEERFLDAQYSLMVSATLRAMVCDELQFWPLVAVYTITPPVGMWMAAHPEQVSNHAWWDMVVGSVGSLIGMLGTVQMQNVARSYLSGAPVLTPRDEEIQKKLHDLHDVKEDIMDTRVDLCEQIDRLAAAELEETQKKLAPIQEAIEKQVFALCKSERIERGDLRRYAEARQQARHDGTEVDESLFPGIAKLKQVVNEDQVIRALHAQDRKEYLSTKIDQLTHLRVALRQQRGALVEQREKAKHDRRAAHSDKLTSFGTSFADGWKDFGHNLSNFFARVVTYEVPFTFYAEVFTGLGTAMMASAAMSAASGGLDAGGFNATANATAGADPTGGAMTAAIGTSALSGLVFLTFVSQRNKALLWPLQKVLYGGYGVARGLKALVWDLPPPVAAAVAAPERKPENQPQNQPQDQPRKKASASEDSDARKIEDTTITLIPDAIRRGDDDDPIVIRLPEDSSSSSDDDEYPISSLLSETNLVVNRVTDKLI